jgi:FkbM family methyltransferase
MRGTLRRARRKAGAIRRRILEPPEKAAWRRAWHRAETTPRYTPGSIRMLDYDIEYPDLLSFCPQWEDIFVNGALHFRASSASPYILDCGANVGLASLYFKRLYPDARITAYEADPRLFAMLTSNLRRNRAGDVNAVHAALWTSSGTVSFAAEGTDSGMVAALPGTPPAEAVSVPSLRLRDVLAAGRVDLLKLDIEGAEDAVLADCEDTLHNVAALVMDLHEFDPSVRQAPRVLDRLGRAGFIYAVADLVTLSWRPPLASGSSPFAGRPMTWAMTVRAWRP